MILVAEAQSLADYGFEGAVAIAFISLTVWMVRTITQTQRDTTHEMSSAVKGMTASNIELRASVQKASENMAEATDAMKGATRIMEASAINNGVHRS